MCVECLIITLIGKQKKPILFKVTEPSSIPYGTHSACAKLVELQCVCFFVLCNRHWFNKAPGPDPRGTEMGVTYLPSALAQTLTMPIYPYPYWVPQSTSGLW